MKNNRRITGVAACAVIALALAACPGAVVTPDGSAACAVNDAAADAIIVWEDDRNENDTYEIRARLMKRDGSFVGSSFVVNTVSSGQQIFARAAMDRDGNSMVVWMDHRGGHYQIYARGFKPDGTERIAEFRVNTGGSTSSKWHPSVAMTCDGEFVVVWTDYRGANAEIYARGFRANGTELFTERRVSPGDGLEYVQPAVAVSGYGGKVVVAYQGGSGDQTADYDWRGGIATWEWHGWAELHVSAMGMNGIATGSDINVDPMLNGQEFNPTIGVDHKGNFVVAWDDFGIDVRAAAFKADGSRYTDDPFIVCWPESPGRCSRPSLAISELGEFLIAWEDDREGNGKYEIRAARFNFEGGAMAYSYLPQSINPVSSGQQINAGMGAPRVSLGHIVVWQDDRNNNDLYEIYARGLSLSVNDYSFSTKLINDDSRGQQVRPTIAYRPTISLLTTP